MVANTPIRVFLVDDHALVRESVSRVLDDEADISVVGAVSDADQAVVSVVSATPDIVLIDIDMPGLSCFEAASQITASCPNVRVIFLSAFFHDRYIEQALRVEARGYLTKSEPMESVVRAVRMVAAGKVCFSREVQSRIVAEADGVSLGTEDRTRASTLSTRELEILRYLAQGLSKKQIATMLKLSVKTIEGHCEKLMSKIDIHDRVELARYAIREGLAEA